MTRDELEKRLEAAEKQMLGLQDEIANLKAKLYEVQEDVIPEFPTNDGDFYIMFENMTVSDPNVWYGSGQSNYNYFHTKEYAQEFADKCKLIAMLLHCKWYLCRDYVPDFANNSEEKHYVYYDVCSKKYTTDWRAATNGNEVFFDTKENAQKAADWLNKHVGGTDNGTE